MLKPALVGSMCLAACAGWAQTPLTPVEQRWIEAAGPVLDFAEVQGLPLDIIVQPQDSPSAPPLAMGFDGGRCKLVLSLRENPDAEVPLAELDPTDQRLALEVMAAHELAHCWRRLSGQWFTVPAGFTPARADPGNGAQRRQHMEQVRREEGFADVFGLAWMAQRHPARYARIHAWFERVRAGETRGASHHDTAQWLHLATDPAAFGSEEDLYEQALTVWSEGLSRIEATDSRAGRAALKLP